MRQVLVLGRCRYVIDGKLVVSGNVAGCEVGQGTDVKGGTSHRKEGREW